MRNKVNKDDGTRKQKDKSHRLFGAGFMGPDDNDDYYAGLREYSNTETHIINYY